MSKSVLSVYVFVTPFVFVLYFEKVRIISDTIFFVVSFSISAQHGLVSLVVSKSLVCG
jgi:hypothetical protein